MAKLHTTRYIGRGIVCKAGTVFFDDTGHAEVPDELAAAYVSELRDGVLVVEKKAKPKNKASVKPPTKKKTIRKKKGDK